MESPPDPDQDQEGSQTPQPSVSMSAKTREEIREERQTEQQLAFEESRAFQKAEQDLRVVANKILNADGSFRDYTPVDHWYLDTVQDNFSNMGPYPSKGSNKAMHTDEFKEQSTANGVLLIKGMYEQRAKEKEAKEKMIEQRDIARAKAEANRIQAEAEAKAFKEAEDKKSLEDRTYEELQRYIKERTPIVEAIEKENAKARKEKRRLRKLELAGEKVKAKLVRDRENGNGWEG